MRGEILALFGVVLAAVLAEHLIPSEQGGGARRALHFLTALVVLILLLRPFLGALGEAREFFGGELSVQTGQEEVPNFDRIFQAAVADRSAADLAAGLSFLLWEEYGIAAECCEIRVSLNAEGELEGIWVFLSGTALLQDPSEVERDLEQRFSCAVEVR